jgi:dTMP kinase
VRSAEAAVATARGLGDARRPVAAPAAPSTAPPPAPLSVRLPQERLDLLPDAVRRSAVEVAQAQRDARTGALALAEQQRADAERARRRAQEEARLAERAARERAAAAEAAERERQQAELMARREAEEARAEEERREASRRRAATERVAPAGERAPGTGTAALPVVDGPGADGRPGLQELQAADRRREAQQRARRRAAASRGGAPAGRARRSRYDGEGALADELFSWQEERDERRVARRAERRGEAPGGSDGPGGTDVPGGTGPR